MELKKEADVKTKGSYARFFKESVTFYGVKSAAVARIAKKYFPAIQLLGKNRIFNLCEELLESDYTEEALIAADWGLPVA